MIRASGSPLSVFFDLGPQFGEVSTFKGGACLQSVAAPVKVGAAQNKGRSLDSPPGNNISVLDTLSCRPVLASGSKASGFGVLLELYVLVPQTMGLS